MKQILWGAAWLTITIGLASAVVMLLWNFRKRLLTIYREIMGKE